MRRTTLLLLIAIIQPALGLELLVNAGELQEQQALEIGLVVFDPGLSRDSAQSRKSGIFPEIRQAEARYIPYALRRTLVDSNHWGAVRVLPEPNSSSELLISGRILTSDGTTQSIELSVRDSRNKLWLQKTYTTSVPISVYQSGARRARRPFQDLYNEVANDLLQLRQQLAPAELRTIRQVAELRYAGELVPTAFADFLGVDETGQFRVLRLPAHNDPMMQRIGKVREQEYLFIDTADEQFAQLYTDMTPVYDLWRQYQREQNEYRAAHEARIQGREKPRSGSLQAYKQSYNNFKWAKIQGQELKLLAKGFNNEISPTSMDIEGTVINLSGSLDERYREWRRVLVQIYAIENATPAANNVQ